MIVVLLRLLRRAVHHPPSLVRVAALLASVIAYGASGFLFFEIEAKPDLGWDDALWWSLVTITTIGYGDFFPTTLGGRFVVGVPLMAFGVGSLGYVLSMAAAALVEAKTREFSGMSKVEAEEHLIVINFPSLGKVERLLDELLHPLGLGPRTPVVLVDEHLEHLPPELATRHVRFVRGNPTRDETLTRASLDRAAVAIVLSKTAGDPRSDEQAISVALAIEGRSRSVRTTVECVDPSSEELLRKAGCDNVVCTSRFDANFLCSEVLHPGAQLVVHDLLSTSSGGQQLFIRDVPEGAKTFSEAARRVGERTHIAIGLQRSGVVELNPGDVPLRPGDQLVTIGPSTKA